jgi:non-specific serine/threonine protein kinase
MQDRMGIWIDLLSLGWIAYLQRDADRAARLLHEGLTLQRELRTTFGVLDSIQVLAGVALRSRQPERAARLFGAADRLGRSLAFSIDWQPAEREESRRDIAVTRGELGDAAFRAAWAEGCSWQLEEAIDFALAAPLRRRRTRPNAQAPGVLSAREMQVARLVAQGLSNRQIAERLVITERTAGAHVEHILDKLQVNWRTQIGVWAAAHLAHEPDAVPST